MLHTALDYNQHFTHFGNTTMNRISKTFQALGQRKALIPYITAGDPDLEATVAIMTAMAQAGADILEVGIPFSDPMADGAVIQRASERALAGGTSLRDVLAAVGRFREHNQDTPVILMGYLNPIHKMGYAAFAQAAAQVGVDGVLTVDCPIESIAPLQNALAEYGIDCIFLIAPTTSEHRMQEIARRAGGFVYYVSLKGVTGSSELDIGQVAAKLSVLRRHIDLPIGVGFGISNTEDAAKIAAVSDAVIIGSRIVREIEAYPQQAAERAAQLVSEFKAAIA